MIWKYIGHEQSISLEIGLVSCNVIHCARRISAILGLISCAGVMGRWELLSHAQNAVRWLALFKWSVETPWKYHFFAQLSFVRRSCSYHIHYSSRVHVPHIANFQMYINFKLFLRMIVHMKVVKNSPFSAPTQPAMRLILTRYSSECSQH